MALDDQAEANLIAGLWNGYLNNEFPTVDTPMSSNYRAVDITPRMFVQMNLAASDTPRGIVWTDKKLIPRRVSFNYDPREAVLLTDVALEAESFPSDAVTGDAPLEPPLPPPDYPPDPPVLCNDPTAINFGLPAPCQYLTPVDAVIVWNGTQIGRSFDFYIAPSPAWVNIRTSGLGISENPNVGYILNVAVADNGSAWCLTYKDESVDGLAKNGVFYCPDVTAATPYWELILSITDYRIPGPPYKTDCPRALAADDTGIFYTQCSPLTFLSMNQYGHGRGALPWPGPSVEFLTPGSVPGGRACMNSQHTVGHVRGISGVRGSHSPAPTPGKIICSYVHDTDSLVMYTTLLGDFKCVSGQFAIESGGGNFGRLIGYTDSPNLNDANWWYIYGDGFDGPDWRTGVVSDIDGNAITVRYSDGYLMIGDTPLATPLAAFGADRAGGGFCIGLAGYGEVIWLASFETVGFGPPTSRFISLRTTGGVWSDKTGDWQAAIGPWLGFTVGYICPDVATISIVAPP